MDNTTGTIEVTQTENTSQGETPVTENVEDVNWRKFREQREKDRKEKEEAEARARKSQEEAEALKAAMDSLLNKQPKQQYQENDPDFDDEETRLQKKIDAAIAARDRAYQEQRIREEQQTFPMRLKQAMPDFDSVCSSENIDYLEYHHPAIAKSFGQMPDGFEKWAGVYDVVKKLVPNSNSKKDQEKAAKNLSKPQSMTRPGMGGTNDTAPYKLDEARKAANWERMQRIRKGL